MKNAQKTLTSTSSSTSTVQAALVTSSADKKVKKTKTPKAATKLTLVPSLSEASEKPLSKKLSKKEREEANKNLSEGMEDLLCDDDDGASASIRDCYVPFRQRSQVARSKKDWSDSTLSAAIGALLERIGREFSITDVNTLATGPAGMRVLAIVNTQLELRAYCRLINITSADLTALTTAGHHVYMPLMIAAGVWAQSTREEALRKEDGSESAASEEMQLAGQLFSALDKNSVFMHGAKLAWRIWNHKPHEVKIGAPTSSYIDLVFDGETTVDFSSDDSDDGLEGGDDCLDENGNTVVSL